MHPYVLRVDSLIFRVLFFGVLLACLASANEGRQTADAAWNEIQQLRLLGDPVLPENYHGMTKSARQDWFEQRALRLREKGQAFLREFPADPRRWTIAAQMIETPPRFITHYGPAFATDPTDVTIDSA